MHSGGLAMALTKYKLGSLIEQCDTRNKEEKYTVDNVRGISTGKAFIETKANMDGVSLTSYKIVRKDEFAYVADTSRRGDKIAVAFNKNDDILISSIYTVFRVNRMDLLLSDYLFMYFNRPEFDRYSRFNSWGSARETFSWEDMCDIEIDLPALPIQQKYVDIYNAMIENQKSYERGLEDLKTTVDAILDRFKHSERPITMSELVEEIDNRNKENKYTSAFGVNIEKRLMPSKASSDDLSNYKIVEKNQFVFSGMQTGRDECIRLALLTDDTPVIVSPAYTVLKTKKEDILHEYIQMWFSRSETDRLGWFLSDSSIRTNLDSESFYSIQIPFPDIISQKSVVDIYKAYYERRIINEKLKLQIKDICPILIKGSLEEETS